MTVGLSTYAFFWQLSDRVENPLTLFDVVEHTHRIGAPLLQICDQPLIETFGAAELEELRAMGVEAGVRLELGTRGLAPDHLRRYLDVAAALDATVLRTMVNAGDDRPTFKQAAERLSVIAPLLAERGVTVALETYEQIRTDTLVELVARVDDPHVGICLDPANAIAALEHPRSVVEQTAAYVTNIHVKDFAFSRREDWVGFNLTGVPLGEGLLDYAHLLKWVRPKDRGISQVIEHWLPWQGDAAQTCRRERQWTTHNLSYLRSTQP